MPPPPGGGTTQAQAQAAINQAAAKHLTTLADKIVLNAGIAALPDWWLAANAIINDPNRPLEDKMEAWMLAMECDWHFMNIFFSQQAATAQEGIYTTKMSSATTAMTAMQWDLAKVYANEAHMATQMADMHLIMAIDSVGEIMDLYVLILSI